MGYRIADNFGCVSREEVLQTGWHLIALALFLLYRGQKEIRAASGSEVAFPSSMGRFFIFTGFFTFCRGLIFLSRELEYAAYLVPAASVFLVLSQWQWLAAQVDLGSTPGWLLKITGFFAILLMVFWGFSLAVMSLEEHLFLRRIYFPFLRPTLCYHYEPHILFNLDLVFSFALHLINFPFLLYFCWKERHGLFSRLTMTELLIFLVLLNDFFFSAGIIPTIFLYEFGALLYLATRRFYVLHHETGK
ncbi:MAG: hypothetical protein AB1403_08760 [Candidatus Riflebacteria bacterium]